MHLGLVSKDLCQAAEMGTPRFTKRVRTYKHPYGKVDPCPSHGYIM